MTLDEVMALADSLRCNACRVASIKRLRDAIEQYARGEACAAAEREQWIGGVRITIPTEAMEQEILVHVRRAAAAERERCAKVADEHARRDFPWGSENSDTYHAQADWAEKIAKTIRGMKP